MAKKATKTGTFDELTDRIAKEVKLNFPKGRMLVSGAGFWPFEDEPVFQGYPLGTQVIDPNEGRVLGYNFSDDEGEAWVIGASYSIDKAMTMETELDGKRVPIYKSGKHLFIRFTGKATVKKSGQKFNKFDVIELAE